MNVSIYPTKYSRFHTFVYHFIYQGYNDRVFQGYMFVAIRCIILICGWGKSIVYCLEVCLPKRLVFNLELGEHSWRLNCQNLWLVEIKCLLCYRRWLLSRVQRKIPLKDPLLLSSWRRVQNHWVVILSLVKHCWHSLLTWKSISYEEPGLWFWKRYVCNLFWRYWLPWWLGRGYLRHRWWGRNRSFFSWLNH